MYINIDRNEKVKVFNITIHGNKSLGEDLIKASLKKTKEKSVFNPMNDLDKVVYESSKEAATLDFLEIGNVLNDHASENIRSRSIIRLDTGMPGSRGTPYQKTRTTPSILTSGLKRGRSITSGRSHGLGIPSTLQIFLTGC
jgi:hypothetical protein